MNNMLATYRPSLRCSNCDPRRRRYVRTVVLLLLVQCESRGHPYLFKTVDTESMLLHYWPNLGGKSAKKLTGVIFVIRREWCNEVDVRIWV